MTLAVLQLVEAELEIQLTVGAVFPAVKGIRLHLCIRAQIDVGCDFTASIYVLDNHQYLQE